MQQQSERPLGELFAELARETGQLLKQELQLAKAETVVKAKQAGRNIALLGLGACLAAVGGLSLTAAAVALLALFMPLWLAAAVVGAPLTLAGVLLASHGLTALKHLDPVPRETIQTLKEDRQWVSEQISR